MKLRIFTCVLAAILFTALLPVSAHAAAFSDTQTHWASAEIEKWRESGIIQGNMDKFRPDDPTSRGEMAVILDRLLKFEDVSSFSNPFNDLTVTKFYFLSILKAYHSGIMFGDGQAMRPDDNISREEAIALLCRSFGLEKSAVPSGFDDAASISPWAVGYVNAMAEHGYIVGYMNKFNPKANISRAEIIKILDNCIAYVSSFNPYAQIPKDSNGIVIINRTGAWLQDVTINGNLVITPGSAGFGGIRLTNVTVNGNLDLRVNDVIAIDGTSFIKMITFEKYPYYEAPGHDTATVLVYGKDTVIEKVYSKVKYPGIYITIPIEYAPGVRDN